MAQALTSRLEVAALERLVARGLVMIVGRHAVGCQPCAGAAGRLGRGGGGKGAAADGAAAQRAGRAVCRRMPEVLAQAIVDQLTAQTVDCLLEAAFGEDAGLCGRRRRRRWPRHPLTAAGLSQHRGVVEMTAAAGRAGDRAGRLGPVLLRRGGRTAGLRDDPARTCRGGQCHRRGGGAGQPAGDGAGDAARRGALHRASGRGPAAVHQPRRGAGGAGGRAGGRGHRPAPARPGRWTCG